jgi:esterase/lipase superfamily enzyme
MSYGSCVVNIPIDAHNPGQIELPKTEWYFWKEDLSAEKHFFTKKVAVLSSAAFINEFKNDDVFVYIHGYRNTFEESLLRSAQLQHDLEFPGKVVAFSWPSEGTYWGYGHDETAARDSPAYLESLLGRLLAEGSSKRKVHILAHSMGNRILLNAIQSLHDKGVVKPGGPQLGYVLLAAADVDGATYGQRNIALFKSCKRVTFYSAADDAALILSQGKHVNKPIGLEVICDKDHMDTIQADKLTSVFNSLGHSYHAESEAILEDIRKLINFDLSPLDRRPPLGARREHRSGVFYFTFEPLN